MHISMTTMTQIWMTFLLSNILLSDHNSDLTLPKCQLVYNIMMQISVHVAQLILNSIHQFVGISPPKHPVDPEKSNRVLGFPALIIGLCQFYGVPVTLTKLIQPPINRSFIKKYCMPRQVQQPGQEQQQQPIAGAPLPPPYQPSSLELQMHTYMRHLAYQQAANARGQMQLNDNFYHYTLHQHR
ncbi:hypothetical protein HKD37_20G056238 [Glycine soja]